MIESSGSTTALPRRYATPAATADFEPVLGGIGVAPTPRGAEPVLAFVVVLTGIAAVAAGVGRRAGAQLATVST
ncbi:MAG TPA: hypothetical protein VE132_17095, partial [Micromonosporaceae bacterium]|nr:hypothetical protein [Micromonosporaceae bacterium]